MYKKIIRKKLVSFIICILCLLPYAAEARVISHYHWLNNCIDKTVEFYAKAGISFSSDIDVYMIDRRTYADIVGYKIADNSDGCTIKNKIYVVDTCPFKDFIIAHELTHQVQKQLFGQSIFKYRMYCEGTADKIAEEITGHKVTMRNWGITNFEVCNKAYEQARWDVYVDSGKKPNVHYMIAKGAMLMQKGESR